MRHEFQDLRELTTDQIMENLEQLEQLEAENAKQADLLVLAKEQMDAQAAENTKLREALENISHEPCVAYDGCDDKKCECPRGMA